MAANQDSEIEQGKHQAACLAVSLVSRGMVVGLGSGSTAALVVKELGRRVVEEGLAIQGVATSGVTARLARECGIPLVELDDVASLDIVIDGADEVDPQFADDQGTRRGPAPREDRGGRVAAQGHRGDAREACGPSGPIGSGAGRGLLVRAPAYGERASKTRRGDNRPARVGWRIRS